MPKEPREPKEKQLLSEWRRSHWAELDKTIATLVSIRDDDSKSARDRTEAGKAIARMVGGMAPETSKASDAPKAKDDTVLSQEEWAKITGLANSIN